MSVIFVVPERGLLVHESSIDNKTRVSVMSFLIENFAEYVNDFGTLPVGI